jgi:hypothetical protein
VRRNNPLLAAAMLSMLAASEPMPLRTAQTYSSNYRPTPPKRDTAMDREIAEWNEAVERRKAEKRARKAGRAMK